MADLSIFDNFDGGALQRTPNDLSLVASWWNQPYLAMFGGNYEQSTPTDEEDLATAIERFDYWGNSIAFPDSPGQQYNSQTERELERVALDFQGIEQIRKVVEQDLDYMKEVADITVTVTLVGVDRIRISILMIEPDSLDQRNFVFLWDGTRLEQIVKLNDVVVAVAPEAGEWILESGDWDDSGIWDDDASWID